MARASVGDSPWDERGEREWSRELGAEDEKKWHAPIAEDSKLVTAELRRLAMARLQSEQPIDATLPPVAQRIYTLAGDPNAGYDQIAKLAATDPPLAGRLIALANNAFFGRGAPVDSLSAAILRVGLGSIRTMLILPVLQAKLVRDPISAALWRHSTLVAAAAPFLASLAKVKPDLAQLAGLLHDVGRILIWMDGVKLKDKYGDLIQRSATVLHEELGTLVLERWKMPGEIVAAVAQHHTPDPKRATQPWERLAHVLCIADSMVRAFEDQRELDPLSIPSVEALGLPATPLVGLAKRLPKLAEESLRA